MPSSVVLSNCKYDDNGFRQIDKLWENDFACLKDFVQFKTFSCPWKAIENFHKSLTELDNHRVTLLVPIYTHGWREREAAKVVFCLSVCTCAFVFTTKQKLYKLLQTHTWIDWGLWTSAIECNIHSCIDYAVRPDTSRPWKQCRQDSTSFCWQNAILS